ncbi:cobalamin-binding protein [Barrientosiimonas marina]|uniref:Cobalamin-binding protein n=1 Tax=Lentibacillus kimchii TaxID=1542911 RepID=A0ABW2UUP2_9BACI
MRVVSICPSNTEIMDYLGQTDLLIGVDDYSDWPDAVQNLPSLGPDLSIDMDKVAALSPDLVLASLSVPGMEKNIEALDEKGLPYLILDPNSLADIADDIASVGAALGKTSLGIDRAKAFRQEVTAFRERAAAIEQKPSLYWEWWPKPIFTPGGRNWLTEISHLAGAENLFAAKDEANVQTTWEDVRERNPDGICMVWVGVQEAKMRPDHVRRRPGWDQITAVKHNHIFVLEESLFCRPSPRLLEGLRQLTALLEGKGWD